ncbi:MAG: STAS domain-containing protein [Ruminococcus sp.]|nr:STAS domain-containing protein [Ruminococcus sp.]
MVRFLVQGKNLTAGLSGDIDHHSASLMRKEIDLEIKQRLPSDITLDFGDVTFMDSSGIGLIMGRCRLMREIGGKVKISNASEQIKKVIKLSGVDRITEEV